MKRLLLCCAAGMSTRMLVQRMEKVAKEKGIDIEIKAAGFNDFGDVIDEYDCCLLGPQIKYKLAEFKIIAQGKNKPIAVINTTDYGMMNGEKVLNDALKMMR
ncbi:PTS sugar transporter subunit IIB [Brenneria izbisi]|uniref:PTS sugar transporter subunit IIB n=1 Tax=Brenneria izbisi TaxID=2939450 RepID=A0AA41Y1G4_9GAMM|nr:PTS sugar transporter subunit IIB [Brenneria izbisi]MCV9878937.1 PTS sugar transporter subunit IIB [Brenneria izbisi]MCV9882399.1 PTS sugar transporter subunit IIB [Brenneria izbisi]